MDLISVLSTLQLKRVFDPGLQTSKNPVETSALRVHSDCLQPAVMLRSSGLDLEHPVVAVVALVPVAPE